MVITIIAYLLTLAAVYWAVTGMLQGLIGGIVGKMFGVHIGMFVGALITWEIVDWLWVVLEGNHLPITVIFGSIGLLVAHGVRGNEELNIPAKLMMSAEQWVLIIMGIYLVVSGDQVRWY